MRKNGVAREHDLVLNMMQGQIKSKDCPPQTKIKHCPQCFKGKGSLNKNLRPFITYAIRKMLVDKIGYVGFPKKQ